MHLVDDKVSLVDATPLLAAPSIRTRIDDHGIAMRPIRLKSRGRIGIGFVAAIDAKPVTRASADTFDEPLKISAILGLQWIVDAVDDDADLAMRGRPHAEAGCVADDLRADRPPARSGRVRQDDE